MLSLRAAALSDVGLIRGENEDRCLFQENLGLFGVADGVGGMPAGGEAAQQAVDTVVGAFHALPRDGHPELDPIVQQANRAVAALGARISPGLGIATTLTFGCARAGRMQIAHVGDSRCYLLQDAGFLRLTEDHALGARGGLTRCIGQSPPLTVDVIGRRLAAGERYLFCTDGLTRVAADREIASLLGQESDPAAVLRRLVGLALRRGAPDNVTGVTVFIDEA